MKLSYKKLKIKKIMWFLCQTPKLDFTLLQYPTIIIMNMNDTLASLNNFWSDSWSICDLTQSNIVHNTFMALPAFQLDRCHLH